ncbi:TorF family putative porin [Imhoffiella purpurea]|uniref:Porin n=1 Tax=Imhoffiella purpurea TaxID=1249627 RepID=W9VCP1_9GAMM|nr:TorF family putative porin [Imhoffiella purpurea]EXJ17224.1 hypothetical protein D779_0051 [Imhoffiella purpurea]
MNANPIRAAVVLGAVTMSAGAFQVALAEGEGPHSVSANIGAVSNYIWRGQTQTDDQPAIQGGIDYAHSSGFSAGTWVSNVDFEDAYGNDTNYEWDLYAGFGQSITDDFSYDLNVIYYAYPDARDSDFAEVGAGVSYKWLSAGIAYTFYGQADDVPGVDNGDATFDEGDLYYHAALDFALPYELGLNLHGGYYDFRYNDGGNDYGHWGVSVSREAGEFGTFSFNYDQIGRETYDDDPKIWIGWNKEF